jgi:hypothetical protein
MTYKDIVLAMTSTLQSSFEGVHVTSNDVTEGFDRPSFFMEFIAPKSAVICLNRRKRTFTLRLSYFPMSRTENDIELFEIMDQLERKFSEGMKIQVGDDLIHTDQGCSCRVTDKVLHCDIEFETYESIEPQVDDANYMEDITIKTYMK